MNTIDWITRFTIKDETGTHEAMVQMNRPFDYRGYRFFQASFIPVGRARTITVNVTPENGDAAADNDSPRWYRPTLADGTKIKFAEFRGDFTIGKQDPDEDTSDYPNPSRDLAGDKPRIGTADGICIWSTDGQHAGREQARSPATHFN